MQYNNYYYPYLRTLNISHPPSTLLFRLFPECFIFPCCLQSHVPLPFSCPSSCPKSGDMVLENFIKKFSPNILHIMRLSCSPVIMINGWWLFIYLACNCLLYIVSSAGTASSSTHRGVVLAPNRRVITSHTPTFNSAVIPLTCNGGHCVHS